MNFFTPPKQTTFWFFMALTFFMAGAAVEQNAEAYTIAAMIMWPPIDLAWMADLFGIIAAIIAIIRFLLEVFGRRR